MIGDDELARASGAGDHEAFKELIGRYQGRLYSFLLHRAGRAADDVFQEVCVKLWTRLKDYEPAGRFPAWLFTVAARTAGDHLEKEARRAGLPLEDAGPGEAALPDPGPGPEALAEASEAGKCISRALARLPAQQREVFLLREYGGLSFREIALAQGCPLGTALARMRYAVGKLRGLLKEGCPA